MELYSIVDELRHKYARIQLCLITAPTERCGITLIQRMINAGGECVIYGENPWLFFELPNLLLRYSKIGRASCRERVYVLV